MTRAIGIDFSGGAGPWSPGLRSRPTVWLAVVEDHTLIDLKPVQRLDGHGPLFLRLAALLRAGDFDAAAIDAPFSVPKDYLPAGGHAELLAEVAGLPDGPDRAFPLGRDIVSLGHRHARDALSLTVKKPLRNTEALWRARGVNTRSALWNGPRGGAPFAAACLRLIDLCERPCWPWSPSRRGVLAEAFPAAQLKEWSLPHVGYGRADDHATRTIIVKALRDRLDIGIALAEQMIASPDALDAVVASFAALAVARSAVKVPASFPADGWIAVAP